MNISILDEVAPERKQQNLRQIALSEDLAVSSRHRITTCIYIYIYIYIYMYVYTYICIHI